MTFEKTLNRLNDIVDAIENGNTPLEEAMSLYKEGIVISRDCGEILGQYESEILVLQKDSDKTFTLAPFHQTMQTQSNEEK